MIDDHAQQRRAETFMSGSRRSVILGVVVSSALISGINISSVNVALGDIAADLGASTADLQWIVNSYALTYAVLLMAFAALGDHIGQDRLFRAGMAGGIVAAIITATAGSTGVVLLGRVLAGVGAAAVTPSGLSIVNLVSPDVQARSRAIGLWTGSGSLGVAVGPIVGGVLLEHSSWGWVFLVNVPILVVLLVLAHATIHVPRVPGTRRIDVVGSLGVTASLLTLVWPLIEAPERGWTSAPVLVSAAMFVVLARLTRAWFIRTRHPLAMLERRSSRAVSVAAVASGASVFVLGGVMLSFSILLRVVHGLSPIATGLALCPIAACMTVTASLSARVCERHGARRTMAAGLALVGSFSILLAVFASSNLSLILASSALLGIGHGLCSAPSTAMIVDAFPPRDAGTASGVSVTCRQISMLLGVAVMGSVLSTTYQHRLDAGAAGIELSQDDQSAARRSVSDAMRIATGTPDPGGAAFVRFVESAFQTGLRAMALLGLMVAALALTVLAISSGGLGRRSRREVGSLM